MALPVLTFLVGGAAIGGIVVLARKSRDTGHGKPGGAEPPIPGTVDLSAYQNANAAGGSMPTGTVVSDGAGGGDPAGVGSGIGMPADNITFGSSIGTDDAGRPLQVGIHEGTFQISQPPGGPSLDTSPPTNTGIVPPGVPRVAIDKTPPRTAVDPVRLHSAAFALTPPKSTRADITNAYAEHGHAMGAI